MRVPTGLESDALIARLAAQGKIDLTGGIACERCGDPARTAVGDGLIDYELALCPACTRAQRGGFTTRPIPRVAAVAAAQRADPEGAAKLVTPGPEPNPRRAAARQAPDLG